MRFGPVRPLVGPTTIGLSDAVIAALRERVATGYYHQPQVISTLARTFRDRVRRAGFGRRVPGTALPS